MGPVGYAVGDFSSDKLDQIQDIRTVLNMLPQSRAAQLASVVAGGGIDVYGEHLQDELAGAASAAEDVAIRAVIAERNRTAPLAQGEFRVEVIGGRSVFTSKPALGEPTAGAGYEATRPEHQAGYEGEVRLGKAVQDLPDHYVVSYANRAGTHGADVVSVDASGNVYLWDNKVRNSRSGVPITTIQDTPTFAENSPAQTNAIEQAKREIRASSLPQAIKDIALDNLDNRNFFGRTVGDGSGARNSAIQSHRGGTPQVPAKLTTKPHPPARPAPRGK